MFYPTKFNLLPISREIFLVEFPKKIVKIATFDN